MFDYAEIPHINDELLLLTPTISWKILRSNDFLVLPYARFSRTDDPDTFVKNGLIQYFNFKTKEIETHPFGFPDFFRKGNFYGISLNSFSYTLGPNQNIYGLFSILPYIYQFDRNDLQQIFEVPSSMQKFPLNPIKPGQDGDKDYYRKVVAGTGIFGKIIFDPYRDVFYRVFVQPAAEVKDSKTGLVNYIRNRAFTIQILDNQLNVMGETNFPKYRFSYFKDMVVSEKGLLLSLNHPENPIATDDFFQFVIFNISPAGSLQ